MPRLAAIADKLAVVRSIRHDQGNHGAGNHYMMTGAPPRIPVGCGAFVSFHPSLGSVGGARARRRGGLPAYFSMPSMSRSGGPNFLGARYAPFVVADNPNDNRTSASATWPCPPAWPASGSRRGRRLRSEVDRLPRIADEAAADPVAALDEHYEQGYSLITRKEAQTAFDISQEPDKVRDAYGRNSFGQRALLARRLVEAGVPFVTLYDGGWDHHTDIFPVARQAAARLREHGRRADRGPRSAGPARDDAGRSPWASSAARRRSTSDAGRDHWSNAMSVLFAGGGTPGGQVVGATDRKGYAAVERVLSPENFASTIYPKLGIDPDKILYTPQGRPAHLVSDPTPIRS